MKYVYVSWTWLQLCSQISSFITAFSLNICTWSITTYVTSQRTKYSGDTGSYIWMTRRLVVKLSRLAVFYHTDNFTCVGYFSKGSARQFATKVKNYTLKNVYIFIVHKMIAQVEIYVHTPTQHQKHLLIWLHCNMPVFSSIAFITSLNFEPEENPDRRKCCPWCLILNSCKEEERTGIYSYWTDFQCLHT